MKFKVGDKVIVTAGKDKGKKSKISKVLPKKNKVVVEDINLYTRNIRSYQGQPGDRITRERPIYTAKIAILNDKGEADRIGYKIVKGKKKRFFKKTGKIIKEEKKTKKEKK